MTLRRRRLQLWVFGGSIVSLIPKRTPLQQLKRPTDRKPQHAGKMPLPKPQVRPKD